MIDATASMSARRCRLPLWYALCVLLLRLVGAAAQRPTAGGASPIVFLRAGPLRLETPAYW